MSYKVYRRTTDVRGWYEVMLSPFSTFEEATMYIEKYRHYYPYEQQNYRIEFDPSK